MLPHACSPENVSGDSFASWLEVGRAGCISLPLFVVRGETPDSRYGFGVAGGVQSIVFRKEKRKFLRVLYLEVEKCRGKSVAQEKSVFLESARDGVLGWEARCLAESHSSAAEPQGLWAGM